ncbi:SIMPL domain-containing protein [Sphingomonas bacterium]|uniref:SIMPL domain-containing protein n=1 Tax=Sphingomonas bacterium TaxID=1895847 RepID=UPI0020C6127D|nr:SIMPL domain-containing protein [Sphingomonas bacterium]
MFRPSRTAMSALAALPLVAATARARAQSVPPMVPATGTVLDITAQGRTTRIPDLATIRAGVVAQAATASAALADDAMRIQRVLAALKKAGIAPRDIATASVRLNPQYRYADNRPPTLTGYQATDSVSIRFHDIARAGPILDALVAEGANQIDGPDLSLDNPDAALDEARTDAVRRARIRADLYARAAGLHVVRIVSISESGENTGGGNAPMVYARAQLKVDTAIAPGEKDVTATLSVRFLLE